MHGLQYAASTQSSWMGFHDKTRAVVHREQSTPVTRAASIGSRVKVSVDVSEIVPVPSCPNASTDLACV